MIAASAVLAFCTFGLTGCGGQFVGEPVYESTGKQIQIGAWVAPPPALEVYGTPNYITLESFQAIADSGIRTIYGLYDPWGGIQTIINAVTLAGQVGIKYYVRDEQIWQLQDEEDPSNLSNTALAARFNTYKNLPGFAGHLVVDEPGSDRFEELAQLKAKYDIVFPGKMFYVNLFPSYANTSYTLENSYYDYIDKFLNIVQPEICSYDAYPLMVDQNNGSTSLHESLLYNLELVATLSQAKGIPYWKFVQTMGFGLENRAPASQGDMDFQVYVDMAYGMTGIQHFCYWTPMDADRGTSFQDAMVTKEGVKTDNYYYAQKINKEVVKFEETFLNFRWTGTQTNLGTGNTKNVAFNMMNANLGSKLGKTYPYKNARIDSVTSSQDAIIGTFKDGKNYDGFMIVNYSDPGKKLTNEITVKFKDAKKAVVFIEGERSVIDLVNGVFTKTFNSGEGVFIIPFN